MAFLSADSGKGYSGLGSTNIFEMNTSSTVGIHPGADAYLLGKSGQRWTGWFTGIRLGIRTITATSTVVYTDHTILCDASGGAFSTPLPSASDAGATNRVLVFKKIDGSGNDVTLTGTVDGVTNPTLTTGDRTMRVQSNGTAWYEL